MKHPSHLTLRTSCHVPDADTSLQLVANLVLQTAGIAVLAGAAAPTQFIFGGR